MNKTNIFEVNNYVHTIYKNIYYRYGSPSSIINNILVLIYYNRFMLQILNKRIYAAKEWD